MYRFIFVISLTSLKSWALIQTTVIIFKETVICKFPLMPIGVQGLCREEKKRKKERKKERETTPIIVDP